MSRSVRERALIFLLAIGTFLGIRPCQAQVPPPLPENRYTTHATLFGVGRTSLYETYLSPSTYTGPHLSILHETLRKTHWLDGRITTQSILDGFFCYTSNRAGNSDELGGKMNYSIGWHYNWVVGGRLRLMAGGEVHAGLGAIYNNRNSNNPVQAKADIDIDASLMAVYPLQSTFHRPLPNQPAVRRSHVLPTLRTVLL